MSDTITFDRRIARIFTPLTKPARYKGAHGGRGSGKSHFFAEEVVKFCIKRPGARVVCVREVQKSLKESVKLLIEDKIKALGVGRLFNPLHDRIECHGDGIIIFTGMQEHTKESVKSLENFMVAYTEEAQTMTTGSLEMLRPTIRAPGSELWFSWNPRSATDPVDALLRGAEPPPDSIVVKANYRDNPFFPAVLEEERAYDEQHNRDRYGHIWLGHYEPQAIGAIWDRATIEQNRRGMDELRAAGVDLERIVVAVDPAGSAEEYSDSNGIVVCAHGSDGRGYVLEDVSFKATPRGWSQRTLAMFDKWGADMIVVERYGGDMSRHVLETARPGVPITDVPAKRGKHLRAEPISALYHINRISHVGVFPELEDQMCVEEGTLIETDGGQIPVELVTTQHRVMTRNGFAPLRWAGRTGFATELVELKTAQSTLRTTRWHPIFLPEIGGFVNAESVNDSDDLLESPNWANMVRSLAVSTMPSIDGSVLMFSRAPRLVSALFAAQKPKPSDCNPIATAQIAAPRLRVDGARPVYNLSVSEGHLPEFYANGILVHNCLMTAGGYEGKGSPDRVDALVYGLTELFPELIRKPEPARHHEKPAYAGPDAWLMG